MRVLLIAAALFAAAPAVAGAPNGSSLTLQSPAASSRVIIDGAAWRCEAQACVASGGTEQPAARACRRVVARLGKVSAFTWKGEALSADQLAACNA